MENTSRTGMTRSRWEYLKALRSSAPRYIHISAHAKMIQNPAGQVPPMIPWVQRPGETYNIGRNRAKRIARQSA